MGDTLIIFQMLHTVISINSENRPTSNPLGKLYYVVMPS
jgi:hypothetical protein